MPGSVSGSSPKTSPPRIIGHHKNSRQPHQSSISSTFVGGHNTFVSFCLNLSHSSTTPATQFKDPRGIDSFGASSLTVQTQSSNFGTKIAPATFTLPSAIQASSQERAYRSNQQNFSTWQLAPTTSSPTPAIPASELVIQHQCLPFAKIDSIQASEIRKEIISIIAESNEKETDPRKQHFDESTKISSLAAESRSQVNEIKKWFIEAFITLKEVNVKRVSSRKRLFNEDCKELARILTDTSQKIHFIPSIFSHLSTINDATARTWNIQSKVFKLIAQRNAAKTILEHVEKLKSSSVLMHEPPLTLNERELGILDEFLELEEDFLSRGQKRASVVEANPQVKWIRNSEAPSVAAGLSETSGQINQRGNNPSTSAVNITSASYSQQLNSAPIEAKSSSTASPSSSAVSERHQTIEPSLIEPQRTPDIRILDSTLEYKGMVIPLEGKKTKLRIVCVENTLFEKVESFTEEERLAIIKSYAENRTLQNIEKAHSDEGLLIVQSLVKNKDSVTEIAKKVKVSRPIIDGMQYPIIQRHPEKRNRIQRPI